MPKASDIYPDTSKYYKAADDFAPNWKGETWDVHSCTAEDFSGDTKLVLWFKNHDKGIVLNKTNSWACIAHWDDNYEHWREVQCLVETVPRQKPDGTPTRGFIITPVKSEPNDKIPF